MGRAVRPTPLTPHLSLRRGNNCDARTGCGGRQKGQRRPEARSGSSGWSALVRARPAGPPAQREGERPAGDGESEEGTSGLGGVGEPGEQQRTGPEASAACASLQEGPPPAGVEDGKKTLLRQACVRVKLSAPAFIFSHESFLFLSEPRQIIAR